MSLTENPTLQEIVEQLRACGYECEGGRLEFNTHFQALVRLAEREREEVTTLLADQIPASALAFEGRRYCARCGVIFLNVEGDCPVCYYRLMAARYGLRMSEALQEQYVPGEFRCPVCQFRLHSRVLRASDGAVGVNTEAKAEECPNGCGTLRPMTWKESEEESGKVIELLIDERERLRGLAGEVVEAEGEQ